MFLQSSASGEPERIVQRALRILIADDERDTVDTLSILLRQEGHEVFGVYESTEVMPLTRKFQPDAVILDIGMPKLTGYDLARALKAEYGKRCPTLIAVTAYAGQAEKLIGQAVGFDYYFGKPVEIELLLAALAKARSGPKA